MLSIKVSPKLLSTRVIYQGQSEAALSTGAVRSRVIYPRCSVRSRVLSTVTVCDLGLIWGQVSTVETPMGADEGLWDPMGPHGGLWAVGAPWGAVWAVWALCGAHSCRVTRYRADFCYNVHFRVFC